MCPRYGARDRPVQTAAARQTSFNGGIQMQLRLKMAVVAACTLIGGSVGSAQTCLHESGELPRDAQRRRQALTAVRIINTVQSINRQFVTLAQLANSSAMQSMRSESGQNGATARAMRFDGDELLPGWRVHFVLGSDSYAISLRDSRDPCGFTYWSDESGEVLSGGPITRERSLLRQTTLH
jgi:hypothetical protein